MPKENSSKKQGPVPRSWQLQNAKARLSELFRLAQTEGPQVITCQGKGAVIVLPVEEYDQLVCRSKQPSLAKFFADSPLAEASLDLRRDKDKGRDLKL